MRTATFAALVLVASGVLAACASATPVTRAGEDVPLDASAPDVSVPDAATPTVFFHEHVEPILQARCQDCHRAGGTGPFALDTYEQAKARGAQLVDATGSRRMPPWGAGATADCAPTRPLAGDLSMRDDEIATLAEWVAQGSHEGDPSKAPAPRTYANASLSDATHTLPISRYTVNPAERDDFRCFVLDPQLSEDTWFDALDVRPGDKDIVHHALVFLDPNAASRAKGGAAGSYTCFGGPGVSGATLISAWAPGVPATRFGADIGVRVPKGALLVMQMHYHPAATARTDETAFLLRRRATKPTWAARTSLIGNFRSAPELQQGPGDPTATPTFLIPAGAKGHTETMETTLGASIPEVKIVSVGTHMHWVGTNMTVEIERPAARGNQPAKECLLATPHYDFNWQRGYSYEQPIDALPTLKGGDKLRLRCTYDNSTDNRNLARALAEQRLASPVDVRLGEETLDEMCLGAFTVLTPAL